MRQQKNLMALDAGIDWLTATSNKECAGYAWYDLFRQWAADHREEEGAIEDWRNAWYVGQKVSNTVRWGYSEQNGGYILIASGPAAGDFWRQVHQTSHNVTRLDLQVTVKAQVPLPNLAEKCYLYAKENNTSATKKYSLVRNNEGGSTLYVGSRQSAFFGRMYDKGIQAGLTEVPGELWRYEVEIKQPKAYATSQTIAAETSDPNQHAHLVAAYVHSWFTDRAVEPRFSANLRSIAEIGYTLHKTTIERKIEWLRTQVAPTVNKLIELDLEQETVAALFGEDVKLDRPKPGE